MTDFSRRSEQVALLKRLTARRPALRRILTLFVEGHPRKLVAVKLAISRHTVDWHLKRLYVDLGIGSANQLIVLCLDAGIGEQSPPPPQLGGCRAVVNRTIVSRLKCRSRSL